MPAPQYVVRSYGGGAVVAELSQSMQSTDASFAITPTTNWLEDNGSPLGTAGPFTVVIDRFTASVEKILCSSINLVTGVVSVYIDGSDGWSGRGYDGTTPQAHVPGGSSSGVQTCWSSAEAMEANRAVFDVLGAGSSPLAGIPIGCSAPFMGTPLTLPSGFLVEDGSAISRTSHSALFTAITIAATGTTTNGGATITAVSSSITPYIEAGMKVTLVNSGGAVYTVDHTTSTTIVLTSGTGITAGTAGGLIVYPHGAGDGTTTFNLPDSRGRGKVGQGAVGTNAQPTTYVGQTIGTQTVTISQSQLPTSIGTAAAQSASVSDPTHQHGTAPQTCVTTASSIGLVATATNQATFSAIFDTDSASTGISVTNSSSAVTNSGGGNALNVESPGIGCTWIVRVS